MFDSVPLYSPDFTFFTSQSWSTLFTTFYPVIIALVTMIVLHRMTGLPEPKNYRHTTISHKASRPINNRAMTVSSLANTPPVVPSLIERLPVEIQQIVFSLLDYQALIHLSTMNRFFQRRIDPQVMADPLDKIAFVVRAVKDFPQHRPTERGHEYRPGNFECYVCFRVRSPDYFDMFQPASIFVDKHGQIVRDRNPSNGINREIMLRRFCISCGVKEGIHAPFDCLVTRTGRDLWVCKCHKIWSKPEYLRCPDCKGDCPLRPRKKA